MTKLEEKLIQLGYKSSPFRDGEIQWYKVVFDYELSIITFEGEYKYSGVTVDNFIGNQHELNNLVKAWNLLQTDLEVLKK